MGYNKSIIVGKTLELYEYENPLRFNGRRGVRNKSVQVHPVGEIGGFIQENDKDIVAKKGLRRKDNSVRAGMAFRCIVACNLDAVENPLLLTFTYADNVTDIRRGYADLRLCLQRLRVVFGSAFKLITVPEFQERGAVHFHALLWGVQKSSLGIERIWPRGTFDTQFWRHGFLFIKDTDGSERLSSYLAKYMTKAFIDPQLKNQKAYTTTRNVSRPIINKGFSPVWPVVDDFLQGVDNFSLQQREFYSHWLGKGRCSIYKV